MAELTQHVPARDADAGRWQGIVSAAPIPPRQLQRDLTQPVAVEAWIVWERDGAETVRTLAHGWAGDLAHVELRDPRARLRWVWLPAEDARRM